MKLAVYKVRKLNGQWGGTWAGKGLRFGHKIGKTWSTKTALKLAFACAFPLINGHETREAWLKRVVEFTEVDTWQIYELSAAGERWLTVKEFYE